MSANYKDHLRTLSIEQLIDFITITPDFAEKLEIELAGGTHLSNINGPDGYHTGRAEILEVKAQIWKGVYTLRGRGKYGMVSVPLYEKKMETNERVIVVGYDYWTGEVYYRFSFKFEAIADLYLRAVQLSSDKNWGNFDFLPKHYVDHPTFEVLHVAPLDVLEANEHKLQRKFLKMLKGML